MPKTATNKPTAPRPGRGRVPQVRIHNRVAGRPLFFRIPGRSIRLGPGETETIPQDCLVTRELQRLCSDGLVVVEDPTKKRPAARSAAAAKGARPVPKSPTRKRTRSSSEKTGKSPDETRKSPKRRSGAKKENK